MRRRNIRKAIRRCVPLGQPAIALVQKFTRLLGALLRELLGALLRGLLGAPLRELLDAASRAFGCTASRAFGALLRECTLRAFFGKCVACCMPNYRRLYRPGGSYFFTHVTYRRYPWLCTDVGRMALREAIAAIRRKYPFTIDAFVLLPDHFHCIWTLPEDDAAYAKRWQLIKLMVTRTCGEKLALPLEKSAAGERRGEGNLWQRRYWEHCIRDERDFVNHVEYIHKNPVKHGLVERPTDWKFSSVHRYLRG